MVVKTSKIRYLRGTSDLICFLGMGLGLRVSGFGFRVDADWEGDTDTHTRPQDHMTTRGLMVSTNPRDSFWRLMGDLSLGSSQVTVPGFNRPVYFRNICRQVTVWGGVTLWEWSGNCQHPNQCVTFVVSCEWYFVYSCSIFYPLSFPPISHGMFPEWLSIRITQCDGLTSERFSDI